MVPRTSQFSQASTTPNRQSVASAFAGSDTVQSMLHKDLSFYLWEVFGLGETIDQRERFAHLDKASAEQFLQTASEIALDKFANHNRKNDQVEPSWSGLADASPETNPEIGDALQAFAEAGFAAAHAESEEGGLQVPFLLHGALMSFFYAANVGTSAYSLLTIGATNLLMHHGTKEQKERLLPKMLAGEWFGTMNLSEPDCGSSLGDIKTSAKKVLDAHGDALYAIKGNKMWISGGDHTISDNIVHLVLARVEGAPAGVKGISLFAVPKYHSKDIPELNIIAGDRNDVMVGGVNHKMGWRGTVNCLLSYGATDSGPGAIGSLIGKEGQGLQCMFCMMNEARVGVGLTASMLGYAGYVYSLLYAKERKQGRAIGDKDPTSPPVAIIEHADVRRMLMEQKSIVEGGTLLCLYCAQLVDEEKSAAGQHDGGQAALLLQVLTPVAKSFPSEWALEANKLAIQVLGGYGYTRDFPVEQLYRDNRLNMIHEGTNGIQAMDLLARKVMMGKGAGLKVLVAGIHATVEHALTAAAEVSAEDAAVLKELASSLRDAATLMEETTREVAAKAGGDLRLLTANAYTYLELVGRVVVAWMLLRQSIAAARLGQRGGEGYSAEFLRGKTASALFFSRHHLSRCATSAAVLVSLDRTALDARPDMF